MEKLKVNIFVKNLLLKKPKNIIYTKKNPGYPNYILSLLEN